MKEDRKFYRVTLEFSNGRTQDDIALASDSAEDAREYVAYRTDELEVKPTSIMVKRISKTEAKDIVDSNGIDWAGL